MDALYDRTQDKALVAFSGQTDIPYLKFLKPGFRHCFIILRTPDRWISIDPLAHMTRIDLHDISREQDVPALLKEHGLIVVETHLREAPLVPSPPMVCTCVEIVKRILGIQCWSIWTPWQLYRHLQSDCRINHHSQQRS